ncbi:hypothetical protein CLOSTMETH_01195 [[Clostridium] methylpentosum DSM 5476]|uniref:Uncharacterized protein n=1 Tax=[Clostridium] methylpentosum DSM 5476 TaxID=537013 RepID=C0EBH7_9FIRM|nr:hypothetical protein CLOSTMETH_01195 [[Clostridium] methylpentosum DSM 5476]
MQLPNLLDCSLEVLPAKIFYRAMPCLFGRQKLNYQQIPQLIYNEIRQNLKSFPTLIDYDSIVN